MKLQVGSRWQSTCCSTQVIVVRAPDHDLQLECGGPPMQPVVAGTEIERSAEPVSPFAEGTAVGKRYRDDELGLELLCTKAGEGSLSADGHRIAVAEAKALPASD